MTFCFALPAVVFFILLGQIEAANQYYAVGDISTSLEHYSIAVRPTPTWSSTVNITVRPGYWHTVVLAGNELFAAGYNMYGQLGLNKTDNYVYNTYVRMTPTWLPAATITAIAVGDHHTVVVADGVLFAVGINTNGQNGDNTTVDKPVFVPMIPTWPGHMMPTIVSASTSNTGAVVDGSMYGVGDNSFGQVGDGTANNTRYVLVPAICTWGNGTIAAISAGQEHMAILAGGQVFAVGSNTYGQLGDGTIVSKTNFTQAVAVWGGAVNVTAIAAGAYQTMVLAGYAVFSAGYNGDGRLGLDAFDAYRSFFTPVVSAWGRFARVTAIAAGSGHSVVLVGMQIC
eukprot:EG_transcript_15326